MHDAFVIELETGVVDSVSQGMTSRRVAAERGQVDPDAVESAIDEISVLARQALQISGMRWATVHMWWEDTA